MRDGHDDRVDVDAFRDFLRGIVYRIDSERVGHLSRPGFIHVRARNQPGGVCPGESRSEIEAALPAASDQPDTQHFRHGNLL